MITSAYRALYKVKSHFTMIDYKDVLIERDQQLLLKDVNLHIGEGEFVYLIGEVGSGKSSLLKTIYAELPISEGEASVFEYNLRLIRRRQIPLLRRRLGIIFQDFQLLIDRTVQQNLEFVLKATGWKNKVEIADRIKDVLQMVGMENKGYRMPNTLSGGEQQRVVIARALLNDPSVILADEPTGNLDSNTGSNIVQLLYDICHKRNTTVLMSTHNLQLLDQFPGRVFKVESGTVTEVEKECEKPTDEPVSENETDNDVEPINDAEPIESESAESCSVENSDTESNDTESSSTESNDTQSNGTESSDTESNGAESNLDEVMTSNGEEAEGVTPPAQSETTEVSQAETQNDSVCDSSDNSNDKGHCSQSDNPLEEQNRSEQSGQRPSESTEQ